MNQIKIGFININNLNSSLDELNNFNYTFDLLFISETHLNNNKLKNINNYNIIFRHDNKKLTNTKGRNSRGLLVLINENIKIDYKILDYSIDHVTIEIINTIFIFLYCEPAKNYIDITNFINFVVKDKYIKYDTLMFGDFNQNIINYNNNQINLINIMKNYGLTFMNKSDSIPSFHNHRGYSNIDHLFVDKKIKNNILNYKTNTEFHSSDHKLLEFELKIIFDKNSNFITNTIKNDYKNYRIFNTEKSEKIKHIFNENLKSQIFNQENYFCKTSESNKINLNHFNQNYNNFLLKFKSVHDKYFKYKSLKKYQKFSFDIKCVKFKLKKLLDSKNIKEYLTTKKIYKKMIYEWKKCNWEDFQLKIISKPVHEKIKLLKFFNKPKQTNMNTPSLQQFKKFFSDKSANIKNFNFFKNIIKSTNNNSIIDKIKIKNLLFNMNSSKAVGKDKISISCFKYSYDALENIIYCIFKICFKFNIILDSWKDTIIYPVYKNKGNSRFVSNWRPIAILNDLRKLYEKILYDELKSKIIIEENQYGFQNKKSTIDLCLVVDYLLKTEYRKNKRKRENSIVFLDISKAYDTVNRSLLYSKLKDKIGSDFLYSIKSLFNNNTYQVIQKNQYSIAFHKKIGLLQGSILSPLLYSFYMNDLIENINKLNINHYLSPYIQNIPRLKCNVFMFADDLVILAKNSIDCQKILNEISKHSKKNKYNFNYNKCFIMSNNNSEMMLDNNSLVITKNFKYLGVEFDINGISTNNHIKNLFLKATKFKINNFFINNNFVDSSINFKIHIFKTFIRPKFEYGMQLCNFNKTNIKKIESIQHWFLTKLLGLSIYTCKKSINTYLNIEDFSTRAYILQLKYLRRLKTYNNLNTNYNLAPLIYKFNMENINNKNLYTINKMYFNIYKNLNIDITKEYDNKTIFEIRKVIMSQNYKNIRNPFLKEIQFSKNSKFNHYSILSKDTHRFLTLLIFKKFPGILKNCKICKLELHSFYNHIWKCTGLPDKDFVEFENLGDLRTTQWDKLKDNKKYIKTIIKVYNTFN